MLAVQYIPEIIKGIVDKTRAKLGTDLFFDKGHYTEVSRNLIQLEGNPNKPKKYPLVWLVMDMKENIAPRLGVYADVDVHIIIANDTDATYTMDQRVNNVFLPVLYPIYQELLNQIMDCPFLFNSLPGAMPHEKYDRYYWGGQDSQGNGQANLFNDCIDAIQIKKITLSVKKQYCINFSINKP